MRYPALVQGAIASSAPLGYLNETADLDAYWRVVTKDATAAAGAAAGCDVNINKALTLAMQLLATPSGAQIVARVFKLCKLPKSPEEFGYFVQAAFDEASMGSYAWKTDYIFGTASHPAPVYPMRVMCEQMVPASGTTEGLLQQLYAAVSVVQNVTEDVPCYDVNNVGQSVTTPKWDFLVCSEGLFNEIPYFPARGMPADMFWKQNYSYARLVEHCQKTFGLVPRRSHFLKDLSIASLPFSSNIVLANGLFDPWHSGGVLWNVSSTIVAYHIPECGHHCDLFFPTPNDPAALQWVRARQLEHIRRWIAEFKPTAADSASKRLRSLRRSE
jgi:hypothetical protein